MQIVIGKRRWKLQHRQCEHPDMLTFVETTGQEPELKNRVMYLSEVEWLLEKGAKVIPPAPQFPEKVTLYLQDLGNGEPLVTCNPAAKLNCVATRTIYLPPEGVLTLDELAEMGVPVWCEDMRWYYGRDMRKMQALYCSYPTKRDAQSAATEWVRQRERGAK